MEGEKLNIIIIDKRKEKNKMPEIRLFAPIFMLIIIFKENLYNKKYIYTLNKNGYFFFCIHRCFVFV